MQEIPFLIPKLSERLQRAGHWILQGESLTDLCCDHGYLGLWAFCEKKCPEVCFVDRSINVIQSLKIRFENEKCPFKFQALSGEALNPVELRGTVVIMGVGSQTAINILKSWFEKSSLENWGFQRLILGAHTKLDKLEHFLLSIGLSISERAIVHERGRERQLWRIDCTMLM